MARIVWLVQRLKAMSIQEIIWRISQKRLQLEEKKRFQGQKMSVVSELFDPELNLLVPHSKKLFLNFENQKYSLNTDIPLLGEYAYKDYKDHWHAGFQTLNEWPQIFSYSLDYKQRDDIGDARTNWELNRHFQFALLAKAYLVSGDRKYLEELQELFSDWNQKNPFLWGISWTSVMEIAIRTNSWCYTYCFLSAAKDVPQTLLEQLKNGILNMTEYVSRHFSRYSSANNHLIVEAYAVGQTGILFQQQSWIDTALSILSRELQIQNYSDGVNKEMSLHYQAFYMEAMGLMIRLLIKNDIPIPDGWEQMLDKMCCYLADCLGSYGEVIEFGDDDEGKILDLHGGTDYCQYILGLYSFLLPKKYISVNRQTACENLYWLFNDSEWSMLDRKSLYRSLQYTCYPNGGVTIVRSNDRRMIAGIDHGALGFGSIAAHGHADALSFQLYMDGKPLFVDPGTYIYHCNLAKRNYFRLTENHNTVCFDRKNQSEMRGPFLWGKRAECRLLDFQEKGGMIQVKACHDGYAPFAHIRTLEYAGGNQLKIIDDMTSDGSKDIIFCLSPNVRIATERSAVKIVLEYINCLLKFSGDDEAGIFIEDQMLSPSYGKLVMSKKVVVSTKAKQMITTIYFEDKRSEDNRYEKQ